MYSVNFSSKAKKQVQKLEKDLKDAVRDYVRKLETLSSSLDLYNNGGTELVGNLKGLWRFKDKSFKDIRLLGTVENSVLIITILAVEGRASSYKNKEKMAREARKKTVISRLGKPTDNCFIESFNRIFCDECLNQNYFSSLSEAKVIIENWRIDYKYNRPQFKLKELTPVQFKNKLMCMKTSP